MNKQQFINFKQLKTGEELYGPDITYELDNNDGNVVFKQSIFRSDPSATNKSAYGIEVKELPSKVSSINVSWSYSFEGIYDTSEDTVVLKTGGYSGYFACPNSKFNSLDSMSIITFFRATRN